VKPASRKKRSPSWDEIFVLTSLQDGKIAAQRRLEILKRSFKKETEPL
jgi:hypothetical protein